MEGGDFRVAHKMIGDRHVFTSPDMPQLFVAHRDRLTAFKDIENVVRQMDRAANRQPRAAFKVVEVSSMDHAA